MLAQRGRGAGRGGGGGGGRGGAGGGQGGGDGGRIRVPNLVPRYEENMRVRFRAQQGAAILVGVITKVETFSSAASGRRWIKYGISQYNPVTRRYAGTHRVLESLVEGRA